MTTKQLAILACRKFVDAFKDSNGPGYPLKWKELDAAHLLAKKAIRSDNMGKNMAKATRKTSRK